MGRVDEQFIARNWDSRSAIVLSLFDVDCILTVFHNDVWKRSSDSEVDTPVRRLQAILLVDIKVYMSRMINDWLTLSPRVKTITITRGVTYHTHLLPLTHQPNRFHRLFKIWTFEHPLCCHLPTCLERHRQGPPGTDPSLANLLIRSSPCSGTKFSRSPDCVNVSTVPQGNLQEHCLPFWRSGIVDNLYLGFCLKRHDVTVTCWSSVDRKSKCSVREYVKPSGDMNVQLVNVNGTELKPSGGMTGTRKSGQSGGRGVYENTRIYSTNS